MRSGARPFRLLAVFGALTLLAAGCDGSDGEGAGGGRTSDLEIIDPDTTTSTVSRAPNGGGEGAPGPGPAPDGGQPPELPDDGGNGGTGPDDGGPGGGSGGGGGGGDGGGGESGGPQLLIDDSAKLGAMGPALLRDDIAKAVVEIDTTPGTSLTSQARTGLADALAEHGGKSVGFGPSSTVPASDVYSTDQLRAMSAEHRATASSPTQVAIHVMVLSGRHENEEAVGIAFGATSFAIFPERLSGGVLGLGYANYEEAIVVHELGHLFGLVNLTGHGAFHEDPDHPGHSRHSNSVMYWAIESTLVGDVFQGGPPRTFNDQDRQEMSAIRDSA